MTPDEEKEVKRAVQATREKMNRIAEKGIDIKGCARCGEDHKKLSFKPLTNPIDGFTFFALCPATGQPVLLKMEGVTL